MAAITEIRRVEADSYSVIVQWSDGPRTYVVTLHDRDGIRSMATSEELDSDFPRYPFLAKRILPLVFGLHDGEQISLPVEIPEQQVE